MNRIFLFVIFFLFQEAKPSPSEAKGIESVLLSPLFQIIILLLTNFATYYFTRPKTESEIQNNYANVIKNNLEIIDKMQKGNAEIFNNTVTLQNSYREKSEKVDELEELLDMSQKELERCLTNNTCAESKDAILKALEVFEMVKEVFPASEETVYVELVEVTERLQKLKPKLVGLV